jgi:NAD(P)-dependent dehydrogenase (short-subunit alcohol dehydrogenase family)
MDSGDLAMRDMWNKSWNVNTTGTHILTHTFVPLLLKSLDPRLLFITSGTSTLTESENLAIPLNLSPAKGWPKTSPSISAYRASKTGMNMVMREWARILRKDGVKTWCVSPGFLATGLGGNAERNKQMGAIDPAIGANLVREVVEGARNRDVGKVVRRDGVQLW